MLPWIESHVILLGLVPIQTWGLFVATGFLCGTWIAARRAKSHGLETRHIWDMAFWIFIAAMLGARLFHVLFYDPGYYLVHPLEAIDPRKPGFAIMGGILGAALVAWRYAQKHGLDFLAYADALVWGLPWGCGIGRIGCFLIHDHPGTLTSFALGIKYPDGRVRHDLGLYLSLLGFGTGIAFLLIDRFRRRHPAPPAVSSLPSSVSRLASPLPGFWLGIFLIVNGFTRFLLDFLRIIDRRVFGLTPTQWTLIATVMVGIILLRRTVRVRPPV